MSGVFAPGAAWDQRRNTSKVIAVPPDALPAALQACRALQRSDPALIQWLLDGHPTLTDSEHVQRFGAPYKGHRARKGDASPDGQNTSLSL